MKRTVFAICAITIMQVFALPAYAEDKWINPQDAIAQLWSARAPAGQGKDWPVDQCNNWNALPANIQAASTRTNSGLVIPTIDIDRAVLTNGLKQMAQSLLAYDLDETEAGHFYPTSDIDGPLNMDATFWQDAARSPHGNALDHLPVLDISGFHNELHMTEVLKDKNRAEVMDTLNNTGNMFNSQRWNYYAARFSKVGQDTIPLTGYVEFTQNEILQDNQYAFAQADGRIVYDYVNKIVYYTPAHYKLWKKADFAPDNSPAYDCNPAGTCCDAFFKIADTK
ncbi:hypothetical protein TH25_15210 [Thalassospira profundimaris]|uniref:Uncharacterized protein n=1 Tax=Thalassospira profundimaris TaxID=502049 RepID=A0A367X1T7_9PROT|nr:hypothetical protein [Thalassospira profundimaris]RCK47633.1 hypothetical protein TH25_15210 [Thalassospira profundimaris]